MRTRKPNTRTVKGAILYHEKNSKYREGNKEAMRQTQRERYKREKNNINAKRKDR